MARKEELSHSCLRSSISWQAWGPKSAAGGERTAVVFRRTLMLGADGVVLGTHFWASAEVRANLHRYAIGSSDDTVSTSVTISPAPMIGLSVIRFAFAQATSSTSGMAARTS